MVIRDYYTTLIRKIGQNSQHCTDWSSLRLRALGKYEEQIWARPLYFRDGSLLRFNETVVIEDGRQIHRPDYSYHNERQMDQDIYYFRYDKDPDAYVPLLHEDCHLHVNQPTPRFPTHETCSKQVFSFVIAQFYTTRTT